MAIISMVWRDGGRRTWRDPVHGDCFDIDYNPPRALQWLEGIKIACMAAC